MAEPGARRRSLLPDTRPLRESPPFRRLWIGTTVSSLGTAMTGFALVLQTYDLTRSSGRLGRRRGDPTGLRPDGPLRVAPARPRDRLTPASPDPLAACRGGPGLVPAWEPQMSAASSDVHTTTRVRSPRNRSRANSSGSPERA
jgi:hypothetical protein